MLLSLKEINKCMVYVSITSEVLCFQIAYPTQFAMFLNKLLCDQTVFIHQFLISTPNMVEVARIKIFGGISAITVSAVKYRTTCEIPFRGLEFNKYLWCLSCI